MNRFDPNRRGGAQWLAALLFALHPVCAESVAWISEQKNTLSAVFYLVAAWVYLRFDEGPERRNPKLWVAATVLFTLALFSKTVTATLPAGLLVVLWWKRGRLSWRRDGVPLIPWFALSMSAGLLTAWVERTYIGAKGASFDLSLVERCLLAARVVWFYACKLVWPSPLIFIYPRWDVHSDSAHWIGYLAALLAVTAALWKIRGRHRGPLSAWLFFVGTLFPALGFFNVYPFVFSYVADHFQYLAALGLFAAAAAGAADLLAGAPPGAKPLIWAACAAVLATLGATTFARSGTYKDLPTLYEATLEQNPSSWMAHNNLGVWYSDRGDAARALPKYLEALRLKPDYAEAHYNLGTLRFKEPGRLADAIAEFQEALRLKPDYPEAHNNLGDALFSQPGRLEEAIAQYREALREEPDFAEAHNNLGQALARLPGHLDEAILQYQEALRLKPGYAEALNNLGNAWSATPGRVDDAIARYQEVLRLNPNSAAVHYNLGNAYSKKPDGLEAAVAEYEAALRLNPNFAEAHHNLGNALAKIPGRSDEAISHYREAVRLKPELMAPR
jgi:tetratricopeptide (TPR) repeat protein